MAALRIRVYGRVQGVFFRANLKDKADELGIKGWIKNEPDGTVLLLAQGPEGRLRELLKLCYNSFGQAEVKKIDYEWLKTNEKMIDFKIIY